MSMLYGKNSQWGSSRSDSYRPQSMTKKSKNEQLEKLLALLTTNVHELASSLWDTLDNEKEEYQIDSNEFAKLKKENDELRRELDKLRKDGDEKEENYTILKTKLNEIEERNKKLKETEKRYLEGHKNSEESRQIFDDEKRKLQETIQVQKDKIKSLQYEVSKARTEHMNRYEQHTIENRATEKKSALEKQLNKTKEKLRQVEDELNETKTRLSQALGNKLINNNPNIADLSDVNRPTKLAETYQEIYDNEWTEAFECLKNIDQDEDKYIVSALLNILMETKSFCEKEAEKQMKEVQLAITRDERHVDSSVISKINMQLKECRKLVAVYSGNKVYEKYFKDLRQSNTSTARKAKRIPNFVESCFKLCWLMVVQDPPLEFGPEIKRGDVFDTDFYKAYTKRGQTVAYVVWPPLLLHSNGGVLCKGVAQGIADFKHQPLSVPNISQRHRNENDEIDTLFNSSDRYNVCKKSCKLGIDDDRYVLSQNGLERDIPDRMTEEYKLDSRDQSYLTHGTDSYSYAGLNDFDISRCETRSLGYNTYGKTRVTYDSKPSRNQYDSSYLYSNRLDKDIGRTKSNIHHGYRDTRNNTLRHKQSTPKQAWRY